MNKIPRFGFIFTPFPLYDLDNIHDFGEATWNATGYSYGETAQEAIINACKYAYQDCTLWNLPRNPTGISWSFTTTATLNTSNKRRFASSVK